MPSTKPSHDFYINEGVKILGEEWLSSNSKEPHQLQNWYQISVTKSRDASRDDKSDLITSYSGELKSFLTVCYNLYITSSNGLLDKTLMRRLKQKKQFQGARYELLILSSCIEAGFSIVLEDDTASGKHPEFIASDIVTGDAFAVEANSRHRNGSMGWEDGVIVNVDTKAKIKSILLSAIEKNTQKPFVVFLDVNLPAENNSSIWTNEVKLDIEELLQDLYPQGKSEVTILVISNLTCQNSLEVDGSASQLLFYMVPDAKYPISIKTAETIYKSICKALETPPRTRY